MNGAQQAIPEFVNVPRIALTGPLFTLDRRGEGWSVAVDEDDRLVTYEIGVDAGSGLLTGSLTIDDAEVLVGLLSFADFQDGPQVRFESLNALGTRIWGESYSRPASLRLVTRLGHLKGTAIVRREKGSPRAPLFTCVADWDLAQWSETGDWVSWDMAAKADGFYRASWVTFSTGFMRWMRNALDVDAATFLRIRSRLGRGIYLYLPSKAYPPQRFSAHRPRTFELGEVLSQLGANVPASRSDRLRMFERPSRNFSVSRELDGARLWCGKFRFQIEERPAPYDHRVRCWIDMDAGVVITKQELLPLVSSPEPPNYGRSGGVLLREWEGAGGSRDRWLALLSRQLEPGELNEEVTELIESGIATEDMAEKNRAVIKLLLQVLGAETMRRVRGAVQDRIRRSAVDPKAHVHHVPKFWMACLKEEVRMAAKREASQSRPA
jgi:hypothetical protein